MPKKPYEVRLVKEAGRGERDSGRGEVPAASHGRFDIPYNEYLATLKPRENKEFQFVCATASDIRFRNFVELLGNGWYKSYTLATLAKKCDISLPQFAEFWQSSQKTIAIARAQGALPDLFANLIEDAKTKDVTCSRCDGYGFVPESSNSDDGVPAKIRTCPQCKGTGTQKEVGNLHARDRILEATDMRGKRSGGGIQITQHFGGMGIESAVDSMSKISFAIDDEVIDVKADQDA